MKKSIKILIVLTLAFALILSLCACKKTTDNNNKGNSSSQNTQGDKEQTNKPDDGGKDDTEIKPEPETENIAFNGDEGFYGAYKAGATDEKKLVSADGYDYLVRYYSDGNDKYTLILRKNDLTEEKLYQFSGKQIVTYVEDSYEKSTEHNIFLSLADEYNCYDGYNTKLVMISCESGNPAVLYNRAVSQMVVPKSSAAGYESIGWILHENRIVPINLYDGSELDAKVFDISKRASLPEISGSFFYYTSAGYEVKTSELEAGAENKLNIKVSEYVTYSSANASIINYVYDYSTETLTRVN